MFRPRERRVKPAPTDCVVFPPVLTLRTEAPATAPSHDANKRHVALSRVLRAEVYPGAKRSLARKREVRSGVACGSSG